MIIYRSGTTRRRLHSSIGARWLEIWMTRSKIDDLISLLGGAGDVALMHHRTVGVEDHHLLQVWISKEYVVARRRNCGYDGLAKRQ
jgi:hypothetical protein